MSRSLQKLPRLITPPRSPPSTSRCAAMPLAIAHAMCSVSPKINSTFAVNPNTHVGAQTAT